jgi:hypothetical protein
MEIFLVGKNYLEPDYSTHCMNILSSRILI